MSFHRSRAAVDMPMAREPIDQALAGHRAAIKRRVLDPVNLVLPSALLRADVQRFLS